MHTADVDATNLPVLRDVDGTPIPFQSWVHQVTVDEEYGGTLCGCTSKAMPSAGTPA